MSKLDGKELDYAVLHGVIHTPETGQLGPVLQNKSDSLRKAVTMTISEPWVIVEVRDAKDPKKIHVLPVPITGFTHTRLAK
jgi:hypothetical protein